MGFLNKFESQVGSAFGDGKGRYAEPISIKKLSKRAAREMENQTYEIDGTDTAPALYTVLVSQQDDALMRTNYQDICDRVASAVEAAAQKKGYVFVDRPLVRFMVDPGLRSGKFSVFAENVDRHTLGLLREEERAFLAGAVALVPPRKRAQAAGAGLGAGAGHAGAGHAGAGRGGSNLGAGPGLKPLESPESLAASSAASAAAAGLGGVAAGIGAGAAGAAGAASEMQPAYPSLTPDNSQAGFDVMPYDYEDDLPVPLVASASESAPMPVPLAVPQTIRNPNVPLVSGAQAAAHVVDGAAGVGPAVAAGADAATVADAAARAHGANAGAAAPNVASNRAALPQCTLTDRATGHVYRAQGPRVIIGRERSQAQVVLRDPNVSRRHAELSFDGQDWHMRDLNSTNGTLINDIDIDECIVRSGDLITVGLINLEFQETRA